jgi:uncharacterized DUF497 family protein
MFDRSNTKKAAENLADHGVSFEEAETVFADDWRFSMPDHSQTREERYIEVGMSKLGRLLFVVYTWRGPLIRLVHARPASETLATRYGRKRR